MDVVCRRLAWSYLFHHQSLLTREERDGLDEVKDVLPNHPIVDDGDFGSFGTITTIAGLAAVLDVSVVCWNQKTLRKSDARQQLIVHQHSLSSPFQIKEQSMTPGEIYALCKRDVEVMHILWNGTNHYSALISASPTPINIAMRRGLLQAAPVTTVNPKSLAPLTQSASYFNSSTFPDVEGYTKFVDCYRMDIVTTAAPPQLKDVSLSALLKATNDSYHGVIFFKNGGTTARLLCHLVPASYSESDFDKAGDFSSCLYLTDAFTPKHLTIKPPSRKSCYCGIHFHGRKASQCTKCDSWIHTACAGKRSDPFVCKNCAE